MEPSSSGRSLKEIARVFLKLGCIGFGGPAAHIAMMEVEVVHKHRWLSQDHFLDLVGATNLIPGPNSTEMAMHCGHEKAGWKGLIVAGACFILPAVIITGALAYAYQLYGQLPAVRPFIYGIQPAIIAVIASLVWSLGRKAVSSVYLAILGIIALVSALWGINELYILFGAGLAGISRQFIRSGMSKANSIYPILLLQAGSLPKKAFDWEIFWIFLKVGAILYGSGYVLFAFLDEELVKTGMLSRQALIDAIAVGQITPGPVFSSATFIGWQMNGLPGAIVATIGIFLPSFLFVALLNPLIPRLRKSGLMSAFLDAVNTASIALVLAVCIQMGETAVKDWRTTLIASLSLVVAVIFNKLNSVWIVLGGAIAGYLLSFL